jgi:hypothetical protein
MLGVPPKSNNAATNDCVMWRLTNTRRPGFFDRYSYRRITVPRMMAGSPNMREAGMTTLSLPACPSCSKPLLT